MRLSVPINLKRRNMNIRHTFQRLGGLLLALSLYLPATMAQDTLTLARCREMALENNKQMAIAEQNQEKASALVKAYRANFLPKISATGLAYYTGMDNDLQIPVGDVQLFDPTSLDGSIPPAMQPIYEQLLPVLNQFSTVSIPPIGLHVDLNNTYSAGVKAEQPVFMGGKIVSAYKMAKTGRELAELNRHLAEAEVIVQTDEAYWLYVRACEMRKSAESYREVVAELQRVVDNAHEAGMKSQNYVMKVQVKLNEADLQVLRADNGVRLARMNLCHVIGLPLLSEVPLPETFDAPLPHLKPEADVTARPEYALLGKQIELKEQEKNLTRSDFLPNIGVMGAYNYAYGVKLNNEPLFDQGAFSAVISVNIPLFQWGEGANKLRAAKTDIKIMELQREDATEQMQLELMQALNTYEEALLEVQFTAKSLGQAEENLKTSRNHYEAGMETLADYLEAQTMWQKASSDLIDAQASLNLSETRYLKAAGKLPVSTQ